MTAPSKKTILLGIAVFLLAIFLALPAFLDSTFTASVSREYPQALSYYYNAVADREDAGLWLFANPEPEENQIMADSTQQIVLSDTLKDNEGRIWHTQDTVFQKEVKLISATPDIDTASMIFQFERGNESTLLTVVSTSGCGYFSRLWKWVLRWQEASRLNDYLASLHELVEEREKSHLYYGCVVSETGMQEQFLAGYRDVMGENDVFRYFSYNAQNLYSLANNQGIQTTGRAKLLRYTYTSKTGSADVMAALPVPSYLAFAEATPVKLPAGTYATTVVKGGDDKIRLGRKALTKYLQDRGWQVKEPMIEEYIHETAVDPDPEKWVTKVYVAYK